MTIEGNAREPLSNQLLINMDVFIARCLLSVLGHYSPIIQCSTFRRIMKVTFVWPDRRDNYFYMLSFYLNLHAIMKITSVRWNKASFYTNYHGQLFLDGAIRRLCLLGYDDNDPWNMFLNNHTLYYWKNVLSNKTKQKVSQVLTYILIKIPPNWVKWYRLFDTTN